MRRMFGKRITEFVLTIDIMDEETFTDLMKVIQHYVNEHLDIAYFSVLDETIVNNQQGLRTIWSTRDEGPSYTVDREGGYASHTSYTFGENKPIWVVSNSKSELQIADDMRDMWSGAEDLPPYSTRSQEGLRTSVMCPLRKDGRAIGVVEFAADRYVEPTPASLEEAQTLAAVISRAYQMYEVRRNQRDNTRQALRSLDQALKAESWTRLALPQMFIAYSGSERLEAEVRTAHEAVIKIIREVVGEFSDILTAIFWEDVTEAGNINEQVIRDICSSDYGLCYFSEPNAQGRFEDNANVLFEAGMMQALTTSPNALLRAWIPIREKKSADIPFDIAAERILTISRNDDVFDEEAFADALRQRMHALVGTLKSKE